MFLNEQLHVGYLLTAKSGDVWLSIRSLFLINIFSRMTISLMIAKS